MMGNKAPAFALKYNVEKYEVAVASKELINDYAQSLGNFLLEAELSIDKVISEQDINM